MLLDQGECILSGRPKDVVANYYRLISAPHDKQAELREEIRNGGLFSGRISEQDQEALPESLTRSNPGEEAFYDPTLVPSTTIQYVSRGVEISDPRLTTLEGRIVNNLIRGQDFDYCYKVRFYETAFGVRFGMLIKTVTGFELGGAVNSQLEDAIPVIHEGSLVEVKFRFSCFLLPGTFFLNCGVMGTIEGAEAFLDRQIDATIFRVTPERGLAATNIIDFRIRPTINLHEPSVVEKPALSEPPNGLHKT